MRGTYLSFWDSFENHSASSKQRVEQKQHWVTDDPSWHTTTHAHRPPKVFLRFGQGQGQGVELWDSSSPPVSPVVFFGGISTPIF